MAIVGDAGRPLGQGVKINAKLKTNLGPLGEPDDRGGHGVN